MCRYKKIAILVCVLLTTWNIAACGQVKEDGTVSADGSAVNEQENSEQIVENLNPETSDIEQGGSFELIRQKEDISEDDIADNPSYDPSWTEEEIIKAINERSQYYKASAYYPEMIDYWENVREVRDISNVLEPLFETDKKYYTKEEFESEPMLVIHLAKNEIYARHGYIFTNEDLYNYFMGCIWYSPTCDGTDFDDSILNEYEKANLEILADLDTYF